MDETTGGVEKLENKVTETQLSPFTVFMCDSLPDFSDTDDMRQYQETQCERW